MSNVIDEVLHELIDVASGVKAILTPARGAELHEKVTPGHTDVPVTAEEAAAAQAVSDRLARAAAKAEAEAEAAKAEDAEGS